MGHIWWIWSILDPDVFFVSKDFRLTFIVKRDTIFLFFHQENVLNEMHIKHLLSKIFLTFLKVLSKLNTFEVKSKLNAFDNSFFQKKKKEKFIVLKMK